jgi:hypothetical protein
VLGLSMLTSALPSLVLDTYALVYVGFNQPSEGDRRDPCAIDGPGAHLCPRRVLQLADAHCDTSSLEGLRRQVNRLPSDPLAAIRSLNS